MTLTYRCVDMHFTILRICWSGSFWCRAHSRSLCWTRPSSTWVRWRGNSRANVDPLTRATWAPPGGISRTMSWPLRSRTFGGVSGPHLVEWLRCVRCAPPIPRRPCRPPSGRRYPRYSPLAYWSHWARERNGSVLCCMDSGHVVLYIRSSV